MEVPLRSCRRPIGSRTHVPSCFQQGGIMQNPQAPLRAARTVRVSTGAVLAGIAMLLLAQLSSAATVVKSPDPVAGEYIVQLNVPAAQVAPVAAEMTRKAGGQLLGVWTHAVRGFWLRTPKEGI